MGRLEKIVVVTVLFIVAVILGISLTGGGEEEALEAAARNRRKAAAQAGEANVEKSQAAGVMSASLKLDAPAAGNPGQDLSKVPAPAPAVVAPTPVVAAPVAGSFLVTTVGLEPTTSDDMMLYTWKAGDSFKSLAQTFYGAPLYVARLRAANEGIDDTKLAAGTRVLVPSKAAMNEVRGALGVAAPALGAAAAVSVPWTGGPYKIKDGDVLGTISQTVYGSAKHWQRIYDANKDLIGSNPNRLKVGMELRIPELK